MSFLKDWVGKLVLKKGVGIMFDSLKTKLDGKKTYITVGLGLLVAAVGVLFGPVDLPLGLHVPAVTTNEFVKLLWEGLIAGCIRNGVAKLG